MAATKPIDEGMIEDSIVRALRNVCEKMIRSEVKLLRTLVDPIDETGYHMMSNVGFAGSVDGNVTLYLSDDFAIFATGKVLGMSAGEIEMHGPDVLKDAIGEITNMTAGGFKNQLCDIGFPCKLTLPTIVRGKNLAVAAIKSAHRHVFELQCDGHAFIADIQLKAD